MITSKFYILLPLPPGVQSEPDDYDDGPEKGFRAGLRTAVFQVSNFFSMFGIFIQVGRGLVCSVTSAEVWI